MDNGLSVQFFTAIVVFPFLLIFNSHISKCSTNEAFLAVWSHPHCDSLTYFGTVGGRLLSQEWGAQFGC